MANEIKFNPNQPVVILQVVLRGKLTATARMALDTGASYIMIPWKITKALGLKPEKSRETTQIITASGVEMAPIVTLQSIIVGKDELRNIKAVVHDLPAVSYVDGLLGLNFLKNFKMVLDFKKGTLELTKTNP